MQHTDFTLFLVIIQLAIIITASRAMGLLFRHIGQAQVCGEIAAGLILGPSVLGKFAPQSFHAVFRPSVAPIFTIMSQIGLILLMFLIGLEFDFRRLREDKRSAMTISAVGVVLPFTLGLLLGRWMHAALGLPHYWLGFALFVAVAMSITAIPILGRIMIELNMNWTRLGSVTICAAALDDVTGWILLAVVTAVVRSSFNPLRAGLMIAETIGFGAFMVWGVRPLLKRWISRVMRQLSDGLSLTSLAVLLVLILLAALVTDLIGIFAIFGAFLLGAILYDERAFAKAVKERLHDFVCVFFLPIFFTYTGIRTDIGTMTGRLLWVMCALVVVTAMAGKFGGCAVAARVTGFGWRDSAKIGVMMNTRALMELIVVNVGYDLGLLPKSVFFMLVCMAVVTTFLTTPILRLLLRAQEKVSSDNTFAAAVEVSNG
jgi:Kef-type K+ transport system membrane component KefB